MMKWKARKENLNIGVMELSNLTFNEDYMEVSIDILNVSEELQTEIDKSIEIAKVEEAEKWERICADYPEIAFGDKTWSNEPVVFQYNYLRIVLEDGKPNRYSIETGFEDAKNKHLSTQASTVVDLSEYENELKKGHAYCMYKQRRTSFHSNR